jgi:hypothetical protein
MPLASKKILASNIENLPTTNPLLHNLIIHRQAYNTNLLLIRTSDVLVSVSSGILRALLAHHPTPACMYYAELL